jgi:hypothetical protein
MNWHMFLPNFALGVAEFCRMATSGARRAAIWGSAAKSAVIICRFRQGDTSRALFISAQIVAKTFRACGAYAAQSRASPVVARITVANSMPVFD